MLIYFMHFDAGDNALTGPIPSEIGNIQSLTNLDLGKLCICMMRHLDAISNNSFVKSTF